MRLSQSRSQSMLEAATNVALGFLTALVIQALIYPLFGITTTFVTDGAIAVIFTLASLARSYLVRRAFETASRLSARQHIKRAGDAAPQTRLPYSELVAPVATEPGHARP